MPFFPFRFFFVGATSLVLRQQLSQFFTRFTYAPLQSYFLTDGIICNLSLSLRYLLEDLLASLFRSHACHWKNLQARYSFTNIKTFSTGNGNAYTSFRKGISKDSSHFLVSNSEILVPASKEGVLHHSKIFLALGIHHHCTLTKTLCPRKNAAVVNMDKHAYICRPQEPSLIQQGQPPQRRICPSLPVHLWIWTDPRREK